MMIRRCALQRFLPANLEAWNSINEQQLPGPQSPSWDSSDTHRMLFPITKAALSNLAASETASPIHYFWSHGRFHLLLPAPQTSFSRWQMKVSPQMENKGKEVVGILLPWVGNRYFAQEASRKSDNTGDDALRTLFLMGQARLARAVQRLSATAQPCYSSSESPVSFESDSSDTKESGSRRRDMIALRA